MKTILLAVDFSDASLNASNYALEMAIELKANITLLHIYQIQIYFGDVPILVSEAELATTLKQQLISLKEKLCAKSDASLVIHTEFLEGDFIDKLNEQCNATKPDLVIIGCQGKTVFENALFGSNAIKALKNLHWPIIAVPIDASYNSILNIGLACDLKESLDEKIIVEIKKWVHNFNAKLYVGNIGNQQEYDAGKIYNISDLENQFAECRFTKHFISDDNVLEGLIHFQKECRLDLLVVFPKQYNFFEKIWHFSDTKKLVLNSAVPILALQ
jgi:nucleotide-binding universal stress UspA family protein